MNSYELVKELTFERIAGTSDELKALNIIKGKLDELNLESKVEDFKIPYSNVLEQKLIINNQEVLCNAYLLSGNIDIKDEQLVVVEAIDNLEYYDLEGKVALFLRRINYTVYEKLAKKNVKAIIDLATTLYDRVEDTDLEVRILRDRHLKYGKIPCLTIRTIDAERVLDFNNTCTIKITQEEQELTSHNLICELKGKKKDIITVTAHYDSVKYSLGAYDNATGSATILGILDYLKDKERKYTYRFIWCGAEERGLLGSKAHTNNEENLKDVFLNINLDMTAVKLGYDLACVSGDNELVNYIKTYSREINFPIVVEQDVYSSDSTPFADKGVTAISFARLSYEYGAQIHSRKDNGLYLYESYYNNTLEFIKKFIDKVEASKIIPFKLEIPKNVKEKIDKYYGRES